MAISIHSMLWHVTLFIHLKYIQRETRLVLRALKNDPVCIVLRLMETCFKIHTILGKKTHYVDSKKVSQPKARPPHVM